jgi:tRNA A-37 threonylcarbamoyl transferase component Bud32/uncharacterized RDD family membrane protein YckC
MIEPEPNPAELRLDVTITDPGAEDRQSGPWRKLETLVGEEFAHFRLDKLLGRGAMGEVYLATDMALDRPVAVKVLSKEIAGHARLRRRFFREARAQARLQHPNICHIYYIGEEDDHLFFAMEYVEGESLADRLERDGSIPADEGVELCLQAALALREANRQGFTHRDIKPSNLMIDRYGKVKVVDFGLVKQASDFDGPSIGHQSTIGATPTVVGTPLYMPPEQARGKPVDFRADMYALGATMHHLIAGKPPFEGKSAIELVTKQVSETRPHLGSRSTLRGTSQVDQLLDQMMAKDPGDRFADYDALVDAMERTSPTRTRPAGIQARTTALALDVVAILLLALPFQWLVSDLSLVVPAIAFVYSVVLHGRWGRTVGKALLELDVISTRHHGPPGYWEAAKRYLVKWGIPHLAFGGALIVQLTRGESRVDSPIVIGILAVAGVFIAAEGLLACWHDPTKRTLWDRVAHTQVRRIPHGQ